jgi:hypothetical protein
VRPSGGRHRGAGEPMGESVEDSRRKKASPVAAGVGRSSTGGGGEPEFWSWGQTRKATKNKSK